MKDREPNHTEHDPYWAGEIGLFEGRFRAIRGEPQIVRARVHTGEERYRLDQMETEIVPIAQREGMRTYVHLQPYLAFPDLRLTIDLFPSPQADGAIGAVHSAEEAGMRRERIGNAQAWYYPADRTLVLWEAFLEGRYRDALLAEDANMRRLWLRIEDFLITRFPDATRMTTPFDDPIADRETYQAFLGSLGYGPVAKAAFGKSVGNISQ